MSRHTASQRLCVAWACQAVCAGAISRRVPRFDDSEFFSFSQSESTYDDEGDHGRPRFSSYFDGWEPGVNNPYRGGIVDESFFHESPSGGADVAWQTHYPAMRSGLTGAGRTWPWVLGHGGSWSQQYKEGSAYTRATPQDNWFDESAGTGKIPPGWFEMSVEQMDGFGRRKYPNPASARHWVGWQERSVNTTLKCKDPGCDAMVSLQAFDGNTERARNCKLTVHVKPTDYGREKSGEQVDWISVNNANVSLNCKPRLQGCNLTAPRPFYPCVFEVSLDKLMPTSGRLEVAAKIPQVVDECPYDGHLLYAVPMVTCLVAPKVPPPYQASNFPPTSQPAANGTSTLDESTMSLLTLAPLKCQERGCTASAHMVLNQSLMTLGSCSLTVRINITDFDNVEWGTPSELVEFVKAEGVTLASNVNPNLNPCKRRLQGSPVAASATETTLVGNADVTADASDGQILVEAKISPWVDECARDGNLLDGIAEVHCAVTSLPSSHNQLWKTSGAPAPNVKHNLRV